jgi:tagatose 1,6-diphosphate aldolase
MLAVDQRPPVKALLADSLGVEAAPLAAMHEVKHLLIEALAPLASAVLVDPVTAFPGSDRISPRQGMIMTLEDSIFETRADGRLTSTIDDWSVDKIKRIGADGVKFLAWYRPDAGPGVLDRQQRLVAAVGAACRRADIPFIFELLLYPFPDEAPETMQVSSRRAEMIIESVETFADQIYGVDVFKLESPVSATTLADQSAAEADALDAFAHLDRAAGRPWVLLSGGAAPETFLQLLSLAYNAGASGYLAGRSIWWDALTRYPDLDAVREQLDTIAAPYMERLNRLTTSSATRWNQPSPSRPPLERPRWTDVPSNYAGQIS